MPDNTNRLLASDKLRCPDCTGSFHLDDQLVCDSCGNTFPLVGDIPLLMPKPEEMVGIWQNRFANFVNGQQRNIQSNTQLIESSTLYPPLRERLKTITRARAVNLKTIIELMAPLQELGPGIPPTTNTDALGSFMLLVYLLR
ncbi:MAG: hypothetical protein OEU91_12175, partial [Gammaproteobacteria bacterium]|nr:hypothetical protein [Gammaproteobacteria bacterium]